MQVEVHIVADPGAVGEEGFIRPVRMLPDQKGAGVVYRKDVYPLRREKVEGNRFYIRLTDPTYEKSECPLLESERRLDWFAEDDTVGPADLLHVEKKPLDWDVEGTGFGRYIFFNGGRVELNRVLRLLHATGYSYLRAAPTERVGNGQPPFDWSVRLDTDDLPNAIHAAFAAALEADGAGVLPDLTLESARRERTALHASIHSLQSRVEASEKLLSVVREQFKALQNSQHERARAGRELQDQLRAERERSSALMRELDTASLTVRRLAAAGETVNRLRRNFDTLRGQLRDAQDEIAALRQERSRRGESAVVPAAEVAALAERQRTAESEVLHLLEEQQTIQALLSDAEAERDQFQQAALDSKQALEVLSLEVGEALEMARAQLDSAASSAIGLDVLDAELTDLRTKLANIEAMQTAIPETPVGQDDEAADEEQSRISRTDASLQMLRTLVKFAFPRLRLSELSLEEIIVRRLHTEELWRELHALDAPGDVVRSSNRIGDSDWRELRQHINERTRVYWRPEEGRCLIHVWWKTNGAEQQRLHDALVRNPLFGF